MRLARLGLGRAPSRDAGAIAGGGGTCSVVGSELAVTGRIRAAGELHIHGTVRGEVHASRAVVGPDGFLDGKLVAREAVLQGRVRGQVFAFRVTVEDTAVIEGTLFHHEIAVAPGARLDGRTPWRPVNYFENLSDDFQGEPDEHVRAQ